MNANAQVDDQTLGGIAEALNSNTPEPSIESRTRADDIVQLSRERDILLAERDRLTVMVDNQNERWSEIHAAYQRAKAEHETKLSDLERKRANAGSRASARIKAISELQQAELEGAGQ